MTMKFGINIGGSVSGNIREKLYKLEGFTQGSKKYVVKTSDFNGKIQVINKDIDTYNKLVNITQKEMEFYIIKHQKELENRLKSYQNKLSEYVQKIEENVQLLSHYKNPSLKTEVNLLHNDIIFAQKANELGLGPKILTWDKDYNSYVMEHIDGVPLHKLGDTVKLNAALVKQVCKNIKDAVKLLHKNGVYHNHLRSENIIVDKDLKIYVVNFNHATTYPTNGITGNKTTTDDPDEADLFLMKGAIGDFKLDLKYQ